MPVYWHCGFVWFYADSCGHLSFTLKFDLTTIKTIIDNILHLDKSLKYVWEISMKVTKSRSFYHDKVLPPQKVVMPYDKSHVILSIIMFARIL